MLPASLGNGEHDVEQDRENSARHRGDRLGEQVDDRDQKQRQRDHAKAERYLHSANAKVERNLEFAFAGIRVAQDENGEAVHRETPDHAECVQVGKERDVAAADDNGDDLQDHDNVDDAIAGAKTRMWLAEPVAEHAVFGNAIEHAVRANNRGIHRSGRITVPTTTTNAWKISRAINGPARFIARPPIRFSRKPCRTSSGMIITAKNETSEVKTML